MSAEIDYVEEAKYRDCVCGHSLLHHRSDGSCMDTRTEREKPADLPEPVYDHPLADTDDPWGAWPNNWPPVSEWPWVTKACGCTRFDDYVPEPDEF